MDLSNRVRGSMKRDFPWMMKIRLRATGQRKKTQWGNVLLFTFAGLQLNLEKFYDGPR